MTDFEKMIDESRCVDLKSHTKEEALRELVDVLGHLDRTSPTGTTCFGAIFEREKVISTGVGIEVALPHVKIPSVKDFVIAVGRSTKGIDFESLDEKPVYIVVMIGANDKQAGEFLKVLAQLVLRLKSRQFRKAVMFAKDPKKIRELFVKPFEDGGDDDE